MKTPLHVAVMEDDVEAVTELINKGAKLYTADFYGMTPLHYAVESRNVDIIRLLLNAGAEDWIEDNDKNTPRNMAIKSRNEDILKVFIDNFNINGEDDDGNTLLHQAACFGNSSIVKFLIDNSADVNAKNKAEETPLHRAFLSDNIKIIELLLNAGADIQAKDFYGNTLIHSAMNLIPKSVNILKLLVDAGADLIESNSSGESPFQILALVGNINTVKHFVYSGMDVNKRCHSNEETTAFLDLVQTLHPEDNKRKKSRQLKCLKLIIKNTDINLTDGDRINFMTDILELDQFASTRHIFYKMVLEQVAIFKVLNLQIDSSLIDLIFHTKIYNDYFLECIEELETAKTTKLYECWVSFFHLLVNDRFKFVKYAGNQNLVRDLKKRVKKFPIYGATMQSNVMKGINDRHSFDKATNVLSTYIPIFDSTHLIIKDILDILNAKDWKNLCQDE